MRPADALEQRAKGSPWRASSLVGAVARPISRHPATVVRAAAKVPRFVGDVRPVPLKVITVTKGSSKGAELLVEEWTTKLKR
jgi:hypothetical protein